jgi:glycosyltransferase involved in cell wall biosynthesis
MALRVPDATISVSRGLAEEYSGRGYDSVHYIPNGVEVTDLDEPSYLQEIGVEAGKYAIFVGRLVPEKGAHYLVEAWKRLNTDRKLVIVGDSSFSDDYVASLSGASDNVIFTGYLYGAQLATVFRNAGLFVLPSDLEGLPIVLLESLAYGTPVLASDIDPSREVLGDHGTYFRAGDVDNLTGRLRELLPQMQGMKEVALGLQRRVAAEYDWDRVAEQTEKLYSGLVELKRRS